MKMKTNEDAGLVFCALLVVGIVCGLIGWGLGYDSGRSNFSLPSNAYTITIYSPPRANKVVLINQSTDDESATITVKTPDDGTSAVIFDRLMNALRIATRENE